MVGVRCTIEMESCLLGQDLRDVTRPQVYPYLRDTEDTGTCVVIKRVKRERFLLNPTSHLRRWL